MVEKFFSVKAMLIKKAVDALKVVPYDLLNTGKEVILKYMSSYHSEVAAA